MCSGDSLSQRPLSAVLPRAAAWARTAPVDGVAEKKLAGAGPPNYWELTNWGFTDWGLVETSFAQKLVKKLGSKFLALSSLYQNLDKLDRAKNLEAKFWTNFGAKLVSTKPQSVKPQFVNSRISGGCRPPQTPRGKEKRAAQRRPRKK